MKKPYIIIYGFIFFIMLIGGEFAYANSPELLRPSAIGHLNQLHAKKPEKDTQNAIIHVFNYQPPQNSDFDSSTDLHISIAVYDNTKSKAFPPVGYNDMQAYIRSRASPGYEISSWPITRITSMENPSGYANSAVFYTEKGKFSIYATIYNYNSLAEVMNLAAEIFEFMLPKISIPDSLQNRQADTAHRAQAPQEHETYMDEFAIIMKQFKKYPRTESAVSEKDFNDINQARQNAWSIVDKAWPHIRKEGLGKSTHENNSLRNHLSIALPSEPIYMLSPDNESVELLISNPTDYYLTNINLLISASTKNGVDILARKSIHELKPSSSITLSLLISNSKLKNIAGLLSNPDINIELSYTVYWTWAYSTEDKTSLLWQNALSYYQKTQKQKTTQKESIMHGPVLVQMEPVDAMTKPLTQGTFISDDISFIRIYIKNTSQEKIYITYKKPIIKPEISDIKYTTWQKYDDFYTPKELSLDTFSRPGYHPFHGALSAGEGIYFYAQILPPHTDKHTKFKMNLPVSYTKTGSSTQKSKLKKFNFTQSFTVIPRFSDKSNEDLSTLLGLHAEMVSSKIYKKACFMLSDGNAFVFSGTLTFAKPALRLWKDELLFWKELNAETPYNALLSEVRSRYHLQLKTVLDSIAAADDTLYAGYSEITTSDRFAKDYLQLKTFYTLRFQEEKRLLEKIINTTSFKAATMYTDSDINSALRVLYTEKDNTLYAIILGETTY